MKTCDVPGCTYNVFGNKKCKNHQYLREDKKPTKLKEFKPIRKYSVKYGKEISKYGRESKKYKLEKAVCEFPGCESTCTELHHKKGRGKYLNAQDTWIALCHDHHEWAGAHGKTAIEEGISMSRTVN